MPKKEINIVLGERIKETRKSKRMTREQLAEKIDVSVRFLADVEGGIVGVSLTTLKQLCECLNVSSDYLLGITNEDCESIYDNAIRKLKKIPPKSVNSVEAIIESILDISNS